MESIIGGCDMDKEWKQKLKMVCGEETLGVGGGWEDVFIGQGC